MSVTELQREHVWFLNTLVTIPVGHGDGADGVSVIDSAAPNGDSPPLHVHHDEDEVFHVLEGELRLRVGEADLELGAGETALAPKGVPHTYRVESLDGARWLVITTRGDFERFVRSVSRPAEAQELPSPFGPPSNEQVDALAAVCRSFGIELVGPPLTATE